MTDEQKQFFVGVTLIILFVVLVLCGPVFTIWSVNMLFATDIPVNVRTCAAVAWLLTALHGVRVSVSRSN